MDGPVRQFTIARNQDGRLELFAVSPNQQILHRWQRGPNQQFDAWHTLGEKFTAVESVVVGDGRIELFAIGTDLAVWRNIQTAPNGQFVGWESLGASAIGLWPAVGADGRAVLLARQSNDELWFIRQPRIGTWLAPR